jgi:hypothetical protein
MHCGAHGELERGGGLGLWHFACVLMALKLCVSVFAAHCNAIHLDVPHAAANPLCSVAK